MMDVKTLLLHFFLGGAVIAAVTYFGSMGKGLMAAFISVLPTITIITISSVYLNSGVNAATAYTKGLLLLMPAWILYAVGVMLLLPRVGLVSALTISIAAYVVAAFLIMRFT